MWDGQDGNKSIQPRRPLSESTIYLDWTTAYLDYRNWVHIRPHAGWDPYKLGMQYKSSPRDAGMRSVNKLFVSE